MQRGSPDVKTSDTPTAVDRDTAAAAEPHGSDRDRHLLSTSARRLHRTLWRVLVGRTVVNGIAVALIELILPALGLVVIVVDVAVFWLLDALTPILHTDGFVWVVVAGLLLALLSYLLDNLAGLTPPIMPDRYEEGR
jgi:hypothetical protein